MANSDPTPPESVPGALVDELDRQDARTLRDVARYAERLAERRSRERRHQGDEEGEDPEDLPEDVPPKATITVKEINDNRYYYWQWREGDTVTSKYKGPVEPE